MPRPIVASCPVGGYPWDTLSRRHYCARSRANATRFFPETPMASGFPARPRAVAVRPEPRGSLRYLARMPAGRAGALQAEVRAGRGNVPPPPLDPVQEDADRARLRCQAQRAGLRGLFRQADRRVAQELDVERADHDVGDRGAAARRRAAEEGESGAAPSAPRWDA